LRKSSISDLKDTVDYVLLNRIVEGRNGYSFGLIRTCCSPNHNSYFFEEIPEVSRIIVAVSKLNPPIGGDVEANYRNGRI
jgi:dihydroneopterin aldolase